MKPESSEMLKKDFPNLLNLKGFACDDGWFNIIYQSLRELNYYCLNKNVDLQITQIKEKFAALRIYFDGGDDYVKGVVGLAERLSMNTCEVCGCSPANVKSNKVWLKTLCEKDATELGYTIEPRVS
jgi:hypothetical protein